MAPDWAEITWLSDRENGMGLVPLVQEYAGHLLLVLGDPQGAVERGHAFLLDAQARAELRQRLDWFDQAGRVSNPADWPGQSLWGEGPRPSL